MKKNLALILIVGAVAIAGTTAYFNAKTKSMQSVLSMEIERVNADMVTTARALSIAQPDAVVADVVRDCAARTEYESLLVRLNTLTAPELETIERLHLQCGSYYPELMSVMSMRLTDSFKNYEALTAALNALGVEAESGNLDLWRSLVAKETARAELLTKQSELQGSVITSLRSGNQASLNALLSEAQGVTGSIDVIGIQLTTERAAVLPQQ
jgi:predicted ribosomally synthesized peptide with SipW-like signal peptide